MKDDMTRVDTPTLTELDSLQLEAAMLRAENANLQATVFQHLSERYREQVKDLAKRLEKDGFQLTRVAEGAWVYQPLPPVREVR
jgi:predicted transcriptional regulator of viral defense system